MLFNGTYSIYQATSTPTLYLQARNIGRGTDNKVQGFPYRLLIFLLHVKLQFILYLSDSKRRS